MSSFEVTMRFSACLQNKLIRQKSDPFIEFIEEAKMSSNEWG